MPSRPPSTGAAIAQARRTVAAARLADPDEHFPYKLSAVRNLVEKDAPMGPAGPKDTSVAVQDVMSDRIAHASADVVAAQQAYLEDPSETNRLTYKSAVDDLTAARRSHRRNRVDENGNPIGAIIGTSTAPLADHQRGPRMRRMGED